MNAKSRYLLSLLPIVTADYTEEIADAPSEGRIRIPAPPSSVALLTDEHTESSGT